MRANAIVNASPMTLLATTASAMPAARPVSDAASERQFADTAARYSVFAVHDPAGEWLRRTPALLVGSLDSRLRALPRRGVGAPGGRRPRALRADGARGLPVGPLVAHHPPQARELPRGVRELRDRARRALRRARRRAPARRRRDRPAPREDR